MAVNSLFDSLFGQSDSDDESVSISNEESLFGQSDSDDESVSISNEESLFERSDSDDEPSLFERSDSDDDEKRNRPMNDEVCKYDREDPYTWACAKADFHSSNFKKYYDRVKKSEISVNFVKDSLSSAARKKFKGYGDSAPARCARLWTSNAVYGDVNQAIIKDDRHGLEKWMPFIRGLNMYVSNYPTKKEMRTYRGSSMTSKQQKYYKVDSVVTIAPYVASSLKESSARNFVKGNGVMMEFVVPKGCYNARSLADVSHYQHEAEVLFPAYTSVRVLSNSHKKIKVRVLDNLDHESYLAQKKHSNIG